MKTAVLRTEQLRFRMAAQKLSRTGSKLKMTDLAVLTGYSAFGLRKIADKNPEAIPGLKIEQRGEYRVRSTRSSAALKKWITVQSERKWQRHYKRPKIVRQRPGLRTSDGIDRCIQIEFVGIGIQRWINGVFRKHFATANRDRLEYWRDYLRPAHSAFQEIERRLDQVAVIEGK